MSNNSNNGSVGCLTTIGIVFVILKLVGVIDWSWWFVLMPFYLGIAGYIIMLVIAAGLGRFTQKRAGKRKK